MGSFCVAEFDTGDREVWEAPLPPGGWGHPWPQCIELANTLPPNQWTLVGGLMVQLHAAVAGLNVSRPTTDVDMVLHVETGEVTSLQARQALEGLGV